MKKALNIIKIVAVALLVLLAVVMVIFTIFSITTLDRSDRTLFGYKMFIVKSDSMKATDFEAGDLIFVKEVDFDSLQEGDIISFQSQKADDSYGETITHKIRKKTVDANGEPGFVTYGTSTGTDDEVIVTSLYYYGKYVGKVSNLGHFFNFMNSTLGYFVCIFVPFMLLIIYQGVKCVRLFMRYSQEKTAEMSAEREQIRAEREELEALKAELESYRSGRSK